MNVIFKVYFFLLNIGVTTREDKENKKIRLLNAFCITWSTMIVIITIFDLLFEREVKESLILHGISYFFIIIIFYCQNRKKYIIARIVFLCSIIGVTFVFANYTTPLMLVENFYFVYPLIGVLFIDKKWINIIFLTLCFCLYFIPNLLQELYPENMVLPVLVFCVFLSTFVILNYSEQLNKKHEEKIIENNRELQKAYAQLEKRKEDELALLRLQTLKAQMNPHFMFNTMNSIQNLILKEDKKEAYKFFTKFSSLMRQNLITSTDSFVDLNTELLIVKNYLELEQLRFGPQFLFIIEELNFNSSIKIPSMIIQPYVEEAIRYRLLHLTDREKKIIIKFKLKNKVLICEVVDNGVVNSYEENKEILSKKILEQRLMLLKELCRKDIDVIIKKEDGYTKTTIKIPYIYKNK